MMRRSRAAQAMRHFASIVSAKESPLVVIPAQARLQGCRAFGELSRVDGYMQSFLNTALYFTHDAWIIRFSLINKQER